MFRYRDHIGWNTWKIILGPNSLAAHIDPTSEIWCSGNTLKIRLLYGCSYEQKIRNISEMVLERITVTVM